MLEDKIRAVTKPQYVDTLAKAVKGTGEARQIGILLDGIKMEEIQFLDLRIKKASDPDMRAKLEQVKMTMPERLEKLIDVLGMLILREAIIWC